MKTFFLILLFASIACAQTRRLSVNIGISRTARFERRFDASQIAFSVTANWRLTKRLSLSGGIAQPIQNRWFAYRTGLIFRIY